jgi:uncharacterized damage-inducible protein DinB
LKDILVQLSTYNTWANGLLLQVIVLLPEEKQQQILPGSFESLYQTVLHMLSAESIWWQRMKLQERITIPAETFKGTMKDLAEELQRHDRQWQEWVHNSQEHVFDHVFHYKNFKHEQFKQPLFQMLLHLFNHNTYHRGQLVTQLRQVGVEKIPQTDFIVWSRKK